MTKNLEKFNPGTGVADLVELRQRKVPPGFGLVALLGLLVILACASTPASMNTPANYQEMFDVNLFHERVKLIDSMRVGAAQEDVVKTLGRPQASQVRQDGSTILTYRVRCYMGPEPLSTWPRHVSATYEARFIMDPQGRVSAIQTEP